MKHLAFKPTRNPSLNPLPSFKKGVSGGIDGLTSQHLYDMSEDLLGEPVLRLIETLGKFMNEII